MWGTTTETKPKDEEEEKDPFFLAIKEGDVTKVQEMMKSFSSDENAQDEKISSDLPAWTKNEISKIVLLSWRHANTTMWRW